MSFHLFQLKGMTKAEAETEANNYIHKLNLVPKRDTLVKNLSGNVYRC